MAYKLLDYFILIIGLAIIIKLKLVNSHGYYDDDDDDGGNLDGGGGKIGKRSTPLNENYRLNFEKKLISDLFKNYQVKFGRPVNNMSEKVVVYFGIYLIQIIDLVIYKEPLLFDIKCPNSIKINFNNKGRTKSSAYLKREINLCNS